MAMVNTHGGKQNFSMNLEDGAILICVCDIHHHRGLQGRDYFLRKYDSFELGLDQLKADETISVASASGGPGAQVYSSMCTRPISIISLLN